MKKLSIVPVYSVNKSPLPPYRNSLRIQYNNQTFSVCLSHLLVSLLYYSRIILEKKIEYESELL